MWSGDPVHAISWETTKFGFTNHEAAVLSSEIGLWLVDMAKAKVPMDMALEAILADSEHDDIEAGNVGELLARNYWSVSLKRG